MYILQHLSQNRIYIFFLLQWITRPRSFKIDRSHFKIFSPAALMESDFVKSYNNVDKCIYLNFACHIICLLY